jgi:7,8-dihydro-6-hydroxymethylpterin-pyrophosphokinase
VRWGPRSLDLDILLYGDVIVNQPGLTIPHPLMATRKFVLVPLSEIAREAVHPGLKKNIGQLLSELKDSSTVMKCNPHSKLP